MAARKSLDSGRSEYKQRLQEIFKESDIADKGYLDNEEVDALCIRLQLGSEKERVIQALREREKEKDKVHFENFQHVFFALLEELEAQQSKSPSKPAGRRSEGQNELLKAKPKLVIGEKRYGRKSLPYDRLSEMNQPATAEDSYSEFAQELDKNGHSSPYVEIEGNNVMRGRHGRSPKKPPKLAQEKERYGTEDPFVPINNPAAQQEDYHARTPARSLSASARARSSSRGRTPARGNTPSQFVNEDFAGLFSSLEWNEEGYAESEDVLDLWESLGITNSIDVLKSLGFNADGQVKLTDLSTALDEELANTTASEDIHLASRLTYQHEVRHLKSKVDHSKEKNKKLKLQLSESNARNQQLAREVDDRHAQLDKSWESKMITVEVKYQDQIKALQTELDREREAGAAQASRLRAHLDDVQLKAGQEEQRLSERLASSQKQISSLERELHERMEYLNAAKKQNEVLKKELKTMKEKPPLHEARLMDEDERKDLEEYKQKLERKTAEHKELRDEYDELMEQLENARQQLQSAKNAKSMMSRKMDSLHSSHSRIPLLRGSTLYERLSTSSVDASETDEDDSFLSRKLLKNTPKINARTPSLSHEFSQIEKTDLLEQQRKSLEESHRIEISTLEAKYKQEKEKMVESFKQEKEWVMEEEKLNTESQLNEKIKDLKASYAKEKKDLIQNHEHEKKNLKHQFEEERKVFLERLSQAENQPDTDGSSQREQCRVLQSQVSECQENIQQLKKDNANLTEELKQQEFALIQEFDEERRNLADRFSRELEQHQSNYRAHVDQLFSKGADGLSGKLRDDFLSLVHKHTEEEVGRSQAAILNQLHQDRREISTLLEKEKSEIYKETENQKISLMEKYESEIITLNSEIKLLREKLEEKREELNEVVKRESTVHEVDINSEVVNNLRKEMEEELIIELGKVKETFVLEKRELETQKNLLEEELTETQGLLEAEKNNSSDMNTLKESLKTLKAEKKEVEGMVEGMKEKLFLAYQQKGLEKTDLESKFRDIRHEGFEEGQRLSRQQAFTEGKEEGFEAGKIQGLEEGKEIGKQEGRKEAMSKVDSNQAVQLQESKGLIESLKHEKSVLEHRLTQEKDKSSKCLMQAQDRDQLKARFDQLLGEKHNIEAKHEEYLSQIIEDHQAEKDHLMEEIRKLEQRRIQAQSDKRAVEAHIGAFHQELEIAHQEMNHDAGESGEDSVFEPAPDHSALQDQMTLLQYQVKEAEAAQQELDLLKKDYDTLLQEKCDLEEIVKRMRTKSSDDDQAKIKRQMDHIKTLTEEKIEMKELLDQTSDQLIKSTTSMALSQSRFVRELETLKQKTNSMVEQENYTQLQISLVDQQKLVITLQNIIREREVLVDKVVKEREDEITKLKAVMESKVKDIGDKYELSQELLTKQTEKYKQLCNTSNKRSLLLKDLYVENANLKTTYAESDLHRREAERMSRKLQNKCTEYQNNLSRLCQMLSR